MLCVGEVKSESDSSPEKAPLGAEAVEEASSSIATQEGQPLSLLPQLQCVRVMCVCVCVM